MLRTFLLFLLALGASWSLHGAGEGDASPADSAPRETGPVGKHGESGDEFRSLPAPTPPQAFPPTPSAAENGAAAGPVHRGSGSDTPGGAGDGSGGSGEDAGGECPAEDEECGESCQWGSELGAVYSLKDFTDKVFQTSVQNLKGSSLQLSLCSASLNCNGRQSPTCLNVPGVKPTSTGITVSVEPIEPHIPGKGFKLVLTDGDLCEVTKKPREMTITFPCNPNSNYVLQHFKPSRVTEGQKESVCKYSVEFPVSQFGCPLSVEDGDGGGDGGKDVMMRRPQLTAVQGCVDSLPLLNTEDCHYAGHIMLSLHGLYLDLLCPDITTHKQQQQQQQQQQQHQTQRFSIIRCTNHFRKHYSVYVGPFLCRDPTIHSKFTINCTVERGAGEHLDVIVYRNADSQDPNAASKGKGAGEGERGEEEVEMVLERAVSFKEAINFREKFDKFVELGVGGMKKEINELYRRAFASRGVAPDVLQKMGITHVKGILLYGPPGSGKTLLARTIAKILGTKQVQLINGPEIISKYLGESERNLRAHFQEAQKAWKDYGILSELYVIIIDEIDAICKPRGKTDQSAAGVAYDALVNQLLTLMDGLNEAYNTLVVGLTNRRELLDTALLRPGRFEVQIEVSLPDEAGRREIFEIHTRSMLAGGMLTDDVDLGRLAANTTRFSGAEIAGVVRAASSYALERYQSGHAEETVLLTALDFEQAIHSVNPAYTHSETHVLSNYLPIGYLACGESHDTVVDLTLDLLHTLQHSSSTRVQTVLLYGPRGSGKTTLAAHLAVLGKFSFVKMLTASAVVGQPTLHKVESIRAAFSDAFSSDLAMIVLDDLHRLVEYMKVGSQITVSHELLHTLTTLLTSNAPAGVKVLVVGTLTVEDGLSVESPEFLGLPDLFLQHYHVPLLDHSATLTFLNARNIHKLGGGQFALPGNLEMSVRQLLHAIECACAQGSCSESRSQSSLVRQDHLLDCIMAYVTRQMAELDGPLG